jgi:hypothetical protein
MPGRLSVTQWPPSISSILIPALSIAGGPPVREELAGCWIIAASSTTRSTGTRAQTSGAVNPEGVAYLDQVAAVTDGVGVIPPPPWISANVAMIRERSGQRCRDRLEPRVQLAMPATVYAELHNPQSVGWPWERP